MSVDALLLIICGGFMCICGGFGTYGCYRCFTDKERGRIDSSIEHCDYKKSQPNPRVSSSSSTSFTGTIYTANSDELARDYDGSNVPQDVLSRDHDYALSINPQIIRWKITDNKSAKNQRRTKTAPM